MAPASKSDRSKNASGVRDRSRSPSPRKDIQNSYRERDFKSNAEEEESPKRASPQKSPFDERGRSRNRLLPEEEEITEPDDQLVSLMGFEGFTSTKGKHVKAAKGGGVKQEKKPEYRQYMNREKGFNRPLSPNRK